MTPEHFAAQFEKARYESMLSRRWEDLRESERQTRTSVALTALTSCGLADVLLAAHEDATRAEVFEGLLAQRDAEIARIRAEHSQDIRTLEAAHTEREAALVAELADADARHTAQLADAESRHAAELARLQAAHEAALDQVRTEHESQVDRRRALRDGALAVPSAVGLDRAPREEAAVA